MTPDPFGTAAIRERVLAGWSAAAVRFREDANAEEDLALGGYRDRLLVELAQNAADAASRVGVRGRLLLALRELDDGPVLVAANTGAPLDDAGVEALATLRASAKWDAGDAGDTDSRRDDGRRDDVERDGGLAADTAVGRFGVGFSAVLAVSDEPVVLSHTGGVRFSAADTRALVQDAARSAAGLADELARRDGHVPVLRLPFPADGEPPAGFDTAVLLPLRDGAAEDLVIRLLAELDDTLLLALPGLTEVQIDGPERIRPRTIAEVGSRWHTLRRVGRLDPALLADRPTEERRRTAWSITWAVPTDADRPVPGVICAPTPTDEPLPWPAVLIASFPLDPTRRHVAKGPATDALVREAATGYAELVARLAGLGRSVWPLVPAGLAAGAIDGALRAAAVAELRTTRILAAAERAGPPVTRELLRPRDAVALDPPAGADAEVVAAFADTLAGLVLAPRSARAALDALGVTRMPLADLVEQLPTGRSASDWRRLYGALAPLAADPLVREALAALPVPLADGRVVRGARGLVVPLDGVPAEALAVLGARAVHDEAAHPLLERLGAHAVGPRAALELPEVRAVVATSLDRVEDGDTDHVPAVLALVQAWLATDAPAESVAGHRLDELDWLAELALTDQDGEVAPAGELALPGSVAAQVLDDEAVGLVDPELVQRWGADVLRVVGVLDGLAVVRGADVPLGEDAPEPLAQLPDWDAWTAWAIDQVAGGAEDRETVEATCHELVAVRDLDAVREDAWPQVLDRVAGDPTLREALLRPVRVTVRSVHGRGGQTTGDVLSWTAWWLRRELFDGRPWPGPDADDALVSLLGGVADRRPGAAAAARQDPAVRASLGAVRTVADLDGSAIGDVLDGLADAAVEVDVATALAVWASLAALAATGGEEVLDVEAPVRVRVLSPEPSDLDGGPAAYRTVVVDAAEAVVVDSPQWLQLPQARAAVVVRGAAAAAAVADLLDVTDAGELGVTVLEDQVRDDDVPPAARALLPDAPTRWCEHDALVVTVGKDGSHAEIEWWVEGAGASARIHASTLDGLARGLAWAAGRWGRRYAVAELLSGAATRDALLIDEAFGV